ncbi:hypothetical protein MMC06_000369 [Schaereria dolodes]|nr:hypothetical protein [Schaereria dolodes]
MSSSASQDQVTPDGHLRTQPLPRQGILYILISDIEQTTGTQAAPVELAAAVDELLDTLTAKFEAVSTEIFAKMDEMSRRLDSLEASILAQSGNDNSQAS